MRALIAGSFDPITFGHLDIIQRASRMFSEVFVVVANNPAKKHTFDLKKRKALVASALLTLRISNVKVMVLEGLLAQFMYHHNIQVLIRGVRNTSDFQDELTLAQVNNDIKDVETVFLPTKPDLSNVSSSLAKAIVNEYGNVEKYVPLEVKFELERSLLQNYYIGVVGGIGAGKSTLATRLVDNLNGVDHRKAYADVDHFEVVPYFDTVPTYHINLDKIAHEVFEGTDPYCLHAREMLVQYFGREILGPSMEIDRKSLGRIAFSDPTKMQVLNEVMKKPMEHGFYETIRSLSIPGVKQIFLIEGAVLDVHGWLPTVNCNVINVICDENVRRERIKTRNGISDEEVTHRLKSQIDQGAREKLLNDAAEKHGNGLVLTVDTSENDYKPDIHTLVKILRSELQF